MNKRTHAQSCMYNRGADCDCGFDDTATQTEDQWIAQQKGDAPSNEEIERWEQGRWEPTEQQIIDWVIHQDHAEIPDVEDDWVEGGLEDDQPPFELAPAGGWGGEI